MAYADVAELPAMNAAIDRAAEAAGRRPADVRRLFNINGAFGSDTGFLQGAPRDWAEQLTELTLNTGMSAYILSAPPTTTSGGSPKRSHLRSASWSSRDARRRTAGRRRRP